MSIQASPTIRVVVTDTNILINLAHIGRLDLLGKLPPYSFVVPEEVVREVKEPAQSVAVQRAISSEHLQVVQLTDPWN
jgi:predicted nucleic acid-binding protein